MFEKELAGLLNRHSKDTEINTPDYILASYLAECLELFRMTVKARDIWHWPSGAEESK